MKAEMIFNSPNGSYTGKVRVTAGDNVAGWQVGTANFPPPSWHSGDRTLKPKNCGGAAKYIHWYVQQHAGKFETLLKP
jgi:hypothetical protein